jgi:hypothetical protein
MHRKDAASEFLPAERGLKIGFINKYPTGLTDKLGQSMLPHALNFITACF